MKSSLKNNPQKNWGHLNPGNTVVYQEKVRTLVKALTLDRSSYLLLFGVLSIILNQDSNATPSEKKKH